MSDVIRAKLSALRAEERQLEAALRAARAVEYLSTTDGSKLVVDIDVPDGPQEAGTYIVKALKQNRAAVLNAAKNLAQADVDAVSD